MKKHNGIILKTYFPKKRKMAVLDSAQGKIELVPPHENVCIGALISYHAEQKGMVYFAREFEQLLLPEGWSYADLLFFHHVIELCYYFIPFESHVPGIFDLLQRLYHADGLKYFSYSFKLLFIFKLFVRMGIYPEDRSLHTPYFYNLALKPIDIHESNFLDLTVEKDISSWIRLCIAQHPYAHILKTVHFLDNDRMSSL